MIQQILDSYQFILIAILSIILGIAFIIVGILEIKTTKTKRKNATCSHYFAFHNPEIMEHEPFCIKCKKTLTEINQ